MQQLCRKKINCIILKGKLFSSKTLCHIAGIHNITYITYIVKVTYVQAYMIIIKAH